MLECIFCCKTMRFAICQLQVIWSYLWRTVQKSSAAHVLPNPTCHKIYKRVSIKTYCKFSAPNKLFKFWIQVWATAKETSSQTWLIPKINGDKLKDSHNLPGAHKGHCQTPLHLEPNPAVTIPDNKPYALQYSYHIF